jgi:phospholipid transport system substrate-binding protein
MTRLAMGRNWSQASAEQRKALTDEFRTLLVRTYTTAFTQYKDQQIDYRPLKVAPDETDVVVKSVIRQPGASEPVTVDYRMEKTERAWKVYDVKIAGVSMVETYRGTFNSEVQRGGVDGLLKTLRDRNRAYLAKMETGAK